MNTRATHSATWRLVWKAIVLAIALVVNVSLGLRLFWGTQSVSTYCELQDRQKALEKELAAQDAVNEELSREIRLLQTDMRYVEKMIRQRLNYLKENEILYLFDKKQATSTGAGHERKN